MSRNARRELREAYKEAYAIKDKEIKAQNTLRADYYRGYLWRLFAGSVKIEVPEHWSIDYFRWAYFWQGSIGVCELEGVVVPFAYSVKTLNRWKYPTEVMGSDEVTRGSYKVGEDCELLYMEAASLFDPYGCGVHNLIDIYAQKLANADASIDINMLVSRTPWIFEAENQIEIDNAKAMFTRIMSGAPAVYLKKRKVDPTASCSANITRMPVKENFIAAEVQDEKRSILNEYLTAIGVNNANTDKRERLITDEVNANNEELFTAVALWQDNADRCITKIKNMFGDRLDGELSIKFGGDRRAARYDDISRSNGSIPDQNGEN